MSNPTRAVIVVCLGLLFAAGGCERLSGPSDENNPCPTYLEPIINDNVVALQNYDLSLESIAGDQYSFDAVGANIPDFSVGDIITGKPMDYIEDAKAGFLRKVDQVQESGDQIILDTVEAELPEAIHQGVFRQAVDLNFSEYLKSDGEVEPFRLIDNVDDVLGTEKDVVTLRDIDVSVNQRVAYGPAYVDVEHEIQGSITLTAPVAENAFTIMDGELCSQTSYFRSRVAIDLDLRSKVGVGVSADWDTSVFELFKKKKPSRTFVAWVGFVPVVTVVEFDVIIGIGVHAEGGVELKYGFHGETDLFARALYYDNDWQEIWHSGSEELGGSGDILIYAEAGITAYVKPIVSAKLYGLGGPNLWLKPYVTAEAAYSGSLINGGHEACLGVYWGVSAGGGIDFTPYLPIDYTLSKPLVEREPIFSKCWEWDKNMTGKLIDCEPDYSSLVQRR